MRAATLADIRAAARGLLVEQGADAVTINAVGRAMGMSGPAIYRYYASHEALVAALTTDFYRELVETLGEALAAVDSAQPAARILTLSRAVRAWALARPNEFRWVFTSPMELGGDGVAQAALREAGMAFCNVFLDEVVALWNGKGFPILAPEDMDPALARQLRAFGELSGGRMPPGALHVFLTCWMRLYGMISMEILGQLRFAYSDLEPVFEDCLAGLCELLGVDYVAPLGGRA